MIKLIMFLIDKTDYTSKNIDIARGLNKYPENWSELKRYLRYKFKGR